MRQIWAICTLELKRLLIKPQSYAVMFGMPLIFTLLFGGLLGGASETKVRMLLVDEDGTAVSKSYTEQLSDNAIMDVTAASASEADEQLQNKEISAVIRISSGFQERLASGEPVQVVLQRSPEFTTGAAVEQLLADMLVKTEMEVKAAVSWSGYSGESWETMYSTIDEAAAAQPVSVQKETVVQGEGQAQMGNVAARASGFSIMFVMIVMMSATGAILEARKTGVWYRMLSAPVSKAGLLGGYLLAFFLIGWMQFGMLMLFTNLLFGIQWGNILGLLVLVSAMLLAIIGLALLVAGLVKTVEQQSALGNLLIISTCMISGVYWPIEIEPEFMQRMANFVPQTWAMRGFTELVARGGSLGDITAYTGVLLVFAAVFFAAGLTRVRYE